MADNTNNTNNKKRKWVVKALVIFLVLLALLTFFSNTIMNATIPKVMATYSSRGNLSYTNNASAQAVAENKMEVKAAEGRVVDKVLKTNYDPVSEGEVIVTLVSSEDNAELESLQTQLQAAIRERDYANRQPATYFDTSSYTNAIASADEEVARAQEVLNQAQNKDALVAQAQQVINDNQPTAVSYTAQVESASNTLEQINAQISELESEMEVIESQINVFVALGTPTPTPTPAPGEEVIPAPVPEIPEIPEGEAGDTTRMDELWAQKVDIEIQISQLESQLGAAQDRLNQASAQLAQVQAVIDESQATIEMAAELPTVSAAQNALNMAQSSAASARRTYNEALIQAGITQDQAEDARNDRDEQIANLEKQIEDLEAKLEITELVAPCSGYIFNMALMEGETMLDKNQVVFEVIPENRECTATFTFPASVAQNFYNGMDLTTNSPWISACRIVNIKPDPANPRENRIVKCELIGDSIWPGETITVTADRSNANYDNIIASSAVNEDNSGTFVYVLEQSSTPLGEKYTVKRVDVTVEASDGALTAISGNGLEGVMIVTRSEEPLRNGDRVRLEDYSDTQNN